MMRPVFVTAAILGLALSACSVIPPGRRAAAPPVEAAPGAELFGQTLRVEAANGGISTLRFAPDGTVQATFGERTVNGNWTVAGQRLCFAWGGASRECWPYAAHFRRGETVTVTSERGNVVRVTLL